MSDTFPEPLVPVDVDLRDFPYMPLDVRRLRDSRLVAIRKPEEVLAAILLWSASWHQQPASSLPDDDVELALLAGYGRSVKEYRRVKTGSLHGLILCSDGRWYHPVVAEKAADAWNGRLELEHRRACDRQRKDNKERAERKEEPLPMPPRPALLSMEQVDGIPIFRLRNSGGNAKPAAGIPPDGLRNSRLKGEGEIRGEGEVREREEGKSSAPRGARLQADWLLPRAWGESALTLQPSWTPEHTRSIADKFRDYWIAQPGQKGVKLDWEATWRNWVRQEGPMKINGSAPGGNRQLALEARNKAVAENWVPPELRGKDANH